MDGLWWKIQLKWMIWGENPLFSETSIFRIIDSVWNSNADKQHWGKMMVQNANPKYRSLEMPDAIRAHCILEPTYIFVSYPTLGKENHRLKSAGWDHTWLLVPWRVIPIN